MKISPLVSLLAFVSLLGAGCAASQPVAVPTPSNQPVTPAPVVEQTAPAPSAPVAEQPAPAPTPAPAPKPVEPTQVEIKMSQDGFVPAQIGIKKGTIVLFKNVGANPMWPASDPHPVHTNYSRFDASHPIPPGETYQLNFPDPGVYTFHDHLSPGLRGRIVVSE